MKEFLVNVLGLSEEDAETEACGIEHAIRPDTLDKLLKFVDFVRACGEREVAPARPFPALHASRRLPGRVRHPSRRRRRPCTPPLRGQKPRRHHLHQARAICAPATRGRIAFVSGKGPIRKRLIEMGLTSDTPVEVVRVAPLGDPMEIKVRGYHLSLRKSEAEHVEVEVLGLDEHPGQPLANS